MNSPKPVRATCWMRPLPPQSSHIVAEERGEDVGEAPEVERGRTESSAAQARVPEAVIEIPRLGLREHLVGLDDLAKALVGIGGSRDVGVQLTREQAEGPLDLSLARGTLEAEDLVIIAPGRRHYPKRSQGTSCLRKRFRRSARAHARPRAPSGSPSRSPFAVGRA